MPVTTLIRAGGVAAVLVAPLGVTASASGNTIAASWLAGPVPGLIKGVRIYGQRVSEATDPYEPATWTLLEYLNTGTNFSDRSYIWDRDPINLRFCYVGVDNLEGPFTLVSNLSVIWGPLNQLSLYNQDLTQAIWAKDAGVTVTGAAGTQTVTFTAANQQVIQSCPALLNGQIYTFYHRIQGTAGQTIQLTSYDQDTATSQDFTHTFDGTVQDVVFTRTFGSTGRRLLTGANTYGAVTARTFTTFRTAVSNGTFTQAQMVANWALTSGPGTTRQEPIAFSTAQTFTGNWFHSPLPTVPTVRCSASITLIGCRLSGLSTIVDCTTGGGNVTVQNSRTWAMHPMTNGLSKGYFVDAGYWTNLIVENNIARSGMGIRYKFGRNNATAVRVRYNIHRDIDGRIATSVGGYVRSSYSNIQNRPPGAPLGNNVANFFQAQGSFDGDNAVNPPVPPQGMDVDSNEVTSRPGYGKVEDVLSFIQTRGNANVPYFARNNMLYANMPWDYVWHDTSNPATPYNFGNILTTFNLTITSTGAVAAGATATVTLPGNLFTTPATGTALTFTGGKTATVAAGYDQNTTAFPIANLSAPLVAGDVATIAGYQAGPGAYSGTAIMLADGIRGPTNVAFAWERQSRWGRAENNLTLGPSGIQSVCIGTDEEIRGGTIVNTRRMFGGTITDDGSRPGFYQINLFSANLATALDGSSVAQLISARYGVNNSRGYNGGLSIGSGGADNIPAYTYGNRITTADLPYPAALMLMADWRAERVALALTIGPTS